jgi:hypothetical protein
VSFFTVARSRVFCRPVLFYCTRVVSKTNCWSLNEFAFLSSFLRCALPASPGMWVHKRVSGWTDRLTERVSGVCACSLCHTKGVESRYRRVLEYRNDNCSPSVCYMSRKVARRKQSRRVHRLPSSSQPFPGRSSWWPFYRPHVPSTQSVHLQPLLYSARHGIGRPSMSTQHTATTPARPGKMAQSQSLNHLLNFSLPPRQAQPLPRRSRKYGTQHGVWNKERE